MGVKGAIAPLREASAQVRFLHEEIDHGWIDASLCLCEMGIVKQCGLMGSFKYFDCLINL